MPSDLTTPELRHQVRTLLRQIEEACHRPLFEEVKLSQSSRVDECDADVGGGGHTDPGGAAGRNKKRGLQESTCEDKEIKTWAELLNEASTLLPYMTPEEHALASKLASILFLGYALPNSTGEDLYASRNYREKKARKDDGAVAVVSSSQNEPHASTVVSGQSAGDAATDAPPLDPLGIDLEELLETCTRVHAAQDYGEIDCISDEGVTASFRGFLRDGLGPFLAGRPSHATETDLVHVLAMAVSPAVGVTPPSNDGKASVVADASSSPSRSRAKRLMSCLHPHYFHVNYADRAEIVNILADNFVPPEFESVLVQEQQQQQQQAQGGTGDPLLLPSALKSAESPLFDGALPHLRSSLGAFAAGALSNQDVQTARRALVNVAVYSSHETFVTEEMNVLVAALFDHRAGCRCPLSESNLHSKDHGDILNEAECPYRACGNLLQDFIMKYNGARHYADGAFTRRTLLLLSRGLELRMQNIVKESNADQVRAMSACQISSILIAARALFYFLLPPKVIVENDQQDDPDDQFADAEEEENEGGGGRDVAEEEGRKEECKAKDSLIASAIQLLNHPDALAVRSASKLLSLAFAYGEKECLERHVESIFVTLRRALRRISESDTSDLASLDGLAKPQPASPIHSVVATISRLSPDFADATVTFLLKQEANLFVGETILYLISSIAQSQPRVVAKHLDELDEVYGGKGEGKGIRHLVAIYLSCRLAHFFSSEGSAAKFNRRATELVGQIGDPWSMFQLARHAFCTANFGLSADIFSKHLVKMASSELSSLWYTSISKTARAEYIISKKGALGIPEALPLLQSAICHICSLASLSKRGTEKSQNFSFQLQLLNNRVDFLNLCITVRGLCAEMRQSTIARGTRTQLHQRNAANCFYSLASRYAKLHREYGLLHCQQTRTVLRTIYTLCRFMARAAAKVFSEAMGGGSRLHKYHENTEYSWPKGDEMHPVKIMIDRFSTSIIHPMAESIEPMIRAAAFMEILDSILRAPLPTPRGFFTVKSPPLAQMRMFANPLDVVCIEGKSQSKDAIAAAGNDEAEIVEVLPGTQCTVYAAGKIPESYSSLSDLSFSQVIWWHTITFDGPLLPDDEPFGEEQQGADDNEGNAFDDDDERAYTYKEGEALEAASIQPGGRFILPIALDPIQREGYYMLKVTLGCRDVRCGEFEIPTHENTGVICLCVTSTMVDEETS